MRNQRRYSSCLNYLLGYLAVLRKSHGFSSSKFHPMSPLNHHHRQETVLSASTKTEVSFTLPRFYQGEIDEGSYPSPLHSIHVRSILSDEETAHCLKLAKEYAEKTGCWNAPDLERHATYSTCDFPVEENEKLQSYLNEEIDFDDRIWNLIHDLYGIHPNSMAYLDFFCAHYQARTIGTGTSTEEKKTMDRLEAHRDGSLVSFTLLLNDPSEFEGGGTFFDGLRDLPTSTEIPDNHQVLHEGGVVRPCRAGDAVFQSGKILHGADVVTAGTRTVLVGFIDVPEWVQRPGALSQACRDWGRMDVASYRHERQQLKTQNGTKPGWVLNNERWISPTDSEMEQGRSCLQGFVPAFSSVEHRADPEFQRIKKLEAEDRLLRSILLEEDELPQGMLEIFDGDITVL